MTSASPYTIQEEKREGEKARSGDHGRFREGELAQHQSKGVLVGALRINTLQLDGSTRRRTHGGDGGPRSGHGGDSPWDPEEALNEGELPQRLTAGTRH